MISLVHCKHLINISHNYIIILKKDIQNILVISLEWVLTNWEQLTKIQIFRLFFLHIWLDYISQGSLTIRFGTTRQSSRWNVRESMVHCVQHGPIKFCLECSCELFLPLTLAGMENPSCTLQVNTISLGLSSETPKKHRSYPRPSFTTDFQDTRRQGKVGQSLGPP